MNNNETIIEIKGLTKKFGSFIAVDNVSLNIKKGEIFGFLGPNGAGKSTIIKMLCGLLLPSGGSGTVAGFDIMKESEKIKNNIGYMSQKFSLYDDLTVEENINFYSGIYGVNRSRRKERIEWVLEMADIKDKRKVITRFLSGGYKQRVAFGCAILHEPPMVFLDEPTSGVDPVSRRNFWKLIYSLSEKGISTFVTTHYMDEAEYCDRLSLIYKGRIIAKGTPQELKKQYMTKEIYELKVDNLIEGVSILSKNGFEAAVFASQIHITLDEAEKNIPKIKDILNSEKIKIEQMQKILPSLEDVFVTLIED